MTNRKVKISTKCGSFIMNTDINMIKKLVRKIMEIEENRRFLHGK